MSFLLQWLQMRCFHGASRIPHSHAESWHMWLMTERTKCTIRNVFTCQAELDFQWYDFGLANHLLRMRSLGSNELNDQLWRVLGRKYTVGINKYNYFIISHDCKFHNFSILDSQNEVWCVNQPHWSHSLTILGLHWNATLFKITDCTFLIRILVV